MTNAGIRNKIITLAKTMPVAKLTAIGTKNWAWVLDSKSMGVRPRAVVAVVKKIARKRRWEAATIASVTLALVSRRLRLYWSTKTSESFTTTPLKATTPNIDINELFHLVGSFSKRI